MTDAVPDLPPPPRNLVAAAMCGAGLKYGIAIEAFDHIIAAQFTNFGRQCYEAGVAAERAESIAEVNRWIQDGPLPGNGLDEVAQRNGLVLAANVLGNRAIKLAQEPKPPTSHRETSGEWKE